MSLYGRTDSTANVNKAKNAVGIPAANSVGGGPNSVTKSFVFVDNTEAQLSENKLRGITGPGWWAYSTYTDASGNTRHKSEHLVFISNPDLNANETQSDDTIAADVASAITISGQPTNQTTYAPAGAIRTVTSSGTAAAGTGSYTITNLTAGVTVTNVSGGTAPSGTWSLGVSRAGGTYTVTVNTGGADFAATDTILIPGNLLGGVATTNNLTVTVATVATAAATFVVTASADAGSVVYQWQVQTATGTRWTNVVGATSASLALTGLAVVDSGKKYRVKLTSTAGAEEVISNTATLTVTAA